MVGPGVENVCEGLAWVDDNPSPKSHVCEEAVPLVEYWKVINSPRHTEAGDEMLADCPSAKMGAAIRTIGNRILLITVKR
ncbi:MAG: hypothetical protein ABF321_06470 [Bacteroidia bacterium]